MTTAVDTCVLLDLILDEPQWAARAEDALRGAFEQGRLIVGEVVYAELMPHFHDGKELDDALRELGVEFVPSSVPMAAAAGAAWGEYRNRGGKRNRVVADFLVAAHAQTNADRLLTRDQRFYAGCLKSLTVVSP